jgi:hypothetical protein
MRYGLIAGAIIGVIVGGMFQSSLLMVYGGIVGALLGFGAAIFVAYDPWDLVGREPVGAYRYPGWPASQLFYPSDKLLAIWNDPAYIAKFNSVYGNSNDKNNEPING